MSATRTADLLRRAAEMLGSSLPEDRDGTTCCWRCLGYQPVECCGSEDGDPCGWAGPEPGLQRCPDCGGHVDESEFVDFVHSEGCELAALLSELWAEVNAAKSCPPPHEPGKAVMLCCVADRAPDVGEPVEAPDVVVGATITAGAYGTAIAGDRGTAIAGDCGTAIAGDCGTAIVGDQGDATAGKGGTAIAGAYGTAIAGAYGTADAGDFGTAAAGEGGVVRVGGVAAVVDGIRIRPSVQYLNSNGLLVASDEEQQP